MASSVVDQTDLLVCDGCLCCAATFYNKIPDCIGASGKSECLCISQDVCLKIGAAPLLCGGGEEGSCCRIGCICCAISLKTPTTLCKGQNHCCCYVTSCAFPTDEEIPCVIAACCIMCFPKVGCCQPLAVAKPVKDASAPSTGAPIADKV